MAHNEKDWSAQDATNITEQMKEMMKKLRTSYPEIENDSETRKLQAYNEGAYIVEREENKVIKANMQKVKEHFLNMVVPQQTQAMEKDIEFQQKLISSINETPDSAEKIQMFNLLSSMNDQSEKSHRLALNIFERNIHLFSKKEIQSVHENYENIAQQVSHITEQLGEMKNQLLKGNSSDGNSSENTLTDNTSGKTRVRFK